MRSLPGAFAREKFRVGNCGIPCIGDGACPYASARRAWVCL